MYYDVKKINYTAFNFLNAVQLRINLDSLRYDFPLEIGRLSNLRKIGQLVWANQMPGYKTGYTN